MIPFFETLHFTELHTGRAGCHSLHIEGGPSRARRDQIGFSDPVPGSANYHTPEVRARLGGGS